MLIERPARRIQLIPLFSFSVPPRHAFNVTKNEARFVNGAFPSAAIIPNSFAIRPRTDFRYGLAAHNMPFVLVFRCFGATASA
jgi:hypothetical protein